MRAIYLGGHYLNAAEIRDELGILRRRAMQGFKSNWGVILVTLIVTLSVSEGYRRIFSLSDHDLIISIAASQAAVSARIISLEDFMAKGGRWSAGEQASYAAAINLRIDTNRDENARTREEFIDARARTDENLATIKLGMIEINESLRRIMRLLGNRNERGLTLGGEFNPWPLSSMSYDSQDMRPANQPKKED